MRRFQIAAITGIVACCVLGLEPTPTLAQGRHDRPERAQTVWAGKCGGCQWLWTTRNLTASLPSGTRLFSAEAREKSLIDNDKTDAAPDVDSYLELSIQPLSLCGDLISYERDYYWEGGAHPSGNIDYVTIDVRRPRKPLLLTDLFPDKVVLRALLADRVIKDTLKSSKIAIRPQSSAELVQLLADKSFRIKGDVEYSFSKDLLSRFAFHHVENGQVAVRLNISWGSEIFRFQSTQIGLLLPIPERLASAFGLAGAGKQGFMMREAKKLADGNNTLLYQTSKLQR